MIESWAGGGDFSNMQQQVQQQAYIEIPSEPEEVLDFAGEYWWVIVVIFIVGFISCSIVAVRVFKRFIKKSPWLDELFRMWRTR